VSEGPRVGLVLGAGGVVGQAFEAGALAAIETDLGWDPRTASTIVGTSAGSVTGALLRLGVSATDLAAWAVRAPLSAQAEPVLAALGDEPPEMPPFRLARVLRGLRPPSWALLAATAARPWAARPAAYVAAMVPKGDVVLSEHAPGLHELSDVPVPEDLWICAARRGDGKRVVFGPAAGVRGSLAEAVAASCAIPGYFEPVTVDGVDLVDGAVHSPTNADLLVGEDLDLVVVISPMSAAPHAARSWDAPYRWSLHRQLRGERRQLERSGVPVVVFEPRAGSLRAIGFDVMANDRSDRVVREALLDAGHLMQRPRTSEQMAVLGGRAQDRRQRLVVAG
jgi:NTE family protein